MPVSEIRGQRVWPGSPAHVMIVAHADPDPEHSGDTRGAETTCRGSVRRFRQGVVDVGRGVMAIGGELHADEEATLLDEGARQAELWGINLYPDRPVEEVLEFDSMINVRPSQSNRSRGVEDPTVRRQIQVIVERLVVR